MKKFISLSLSLFISACSLFTPKTEQLDLSGISLCGAPLTKTLVPLTSGISDYFYSVSIVCNKNGIEKKVTTTIITNEAPFGSNLIGVILIKERLSPPVHNNDKNKILTRHARMMKANIIIPEVRSPFNDKSIKVYKAYYN